MGGKGQERYSSRICRQGSACGWWGFGRRLVEGSLGWGGGVSLYRTEWRVGMLGREQPEQTCVWEGKYGAALGTRGRSTQNGSMGRLRDAGNLIPRS